MAPNLVPRAHFKEIGLSMYYENPLKDVYSSLIGTEGLGRESVSAFEVAGSRGNCFVAIAQGTPIGFARVLSDEILCSWLANIWVFPDWRNKGVGDLLLGCVNHRFPQIPLWARANASMVAFLSNRGLKKKLKLSPMVRAISHVDPRFRISGDFSMQVVDGAIEYSTDIDRIQLAALAALYESVGFGTREHYAPDTVTLERLFGAGVFGFFALAEGKLVGVARVLSDDVLCTWFAEVCVHPDWQGRGIGDTIVRMVCDRFGHTAIYADAFQGQEEFFSRNGIMPQSKVVACGRRPIES